MTNCTNDKNNQCPIRSFLCPIFKKIFACNNSPIVACLNLQGVISQDSKLSSNLNFNNIAPLLKQAFETKNAKAVALNINSPGGSPVQSELIYNYIRELSKEKKIPVYTFAQDVAASGGYWLLLSGDEIYAHNSSVIGSIGVISAGFGFVELIKKIGVERRIYSQGKNKAILDPFSEEKEENIEILKDAQKDIYESFTDLVKTRRDGKLKELEDKLFTGAFWSGKKAQQLGLVDEICDMRSKMKEKFGEKVKFINITAKKSFIKNLFSEKSEKSISNSIDHLLNKTEERIYFSKFGL